MQPAKQAVKKTRVNRYEPLLVLIRGTMAVKGIDYETVGVAGGMSRDTIYRRFRAPQEFRIYELSGISTLLEIPWSEILEKLDYSQ